MYIGRSFYKRKNTTRNLEADYAGYMAKCADFTQRLEAMDKDYHSDTDLAYYLEVQTIINKKLLEVVF